MAVQRFKPYRTIPDGAVVTADWQVSVDGVGSSGSTELNWDYWTPVFLATEVTIDLEQVLQATGLASLADMQLVAVADCQPALQRRVTIYRENDLNRTRSAWQVKMHIEEGQVAGDLQLRLYITTSRTTSGAAAGVARQKGMILWESERTTVRLEGTGSRFPTEMVSFGAMGPAMSQLRRAPWHLRLGFESEHDNIRSSIRLLVNTDHPVAAVFSDSRHPQFPAVTGMIRADIVEAVVERLAQVNDLDDPDPERPESLLVAADELTRTVIQRSLADSLEMYRDDPAKFSTSVRHAIGYLSELVVA